MRKSEFRNNSIQLDYRIEGDGNEDIPDEDKNFSAFRNDLRTLDDKLRDYGYAPKNLCSFLWDKSAGYAYYVDRPAIWERSPSMEMSPLTDEIVISDPFEKIGEKFTANDFFYFVEICHGWGDSETKF